MSRLVVGTAQFGSAYGVANTGGRVSREEAARILIRARSAGVDILDTATAYGDSERCLGEIGMGGWRVISKLPIGIPESLEDVDPWVTSALSATMERLGVAHLHALLVHRSHHLVGERGEALGESLRLIRSKGLVDKIGVSIYDPAELASFWNTFRPDLVQAPFSIVDRRLKTSGWLSRLNAEQVEVHVRSIFLQGLLLMTSLSRPARFRRWERLWEAYGQWTAEASLTPVEACVRFARSHEGIDRIVVGIDNVRQLDEILAAFAVPALDAPLNLASDDCDLVDPSRWMLAT